jgi:hypothetical protein
MNVRELLNELGVTFRERGESPHVTAGWIGVVCPFCGQGTTKYGLGIHIRTLRVSCWKCGGHRLGDTLAACTNRHLREIIPLLPGIVPVVSSESGPTQIGRYSPPPGVEPLGEAHRNYLTRRTFDPDEIAGQWGVQGIGFTGQYKWRLFIPVASGGKPVSWTTRSVGEKIGQRYLSAPPTDESKPLRHCLYGEEKVRHTVVVVEGPTDAWAIGPGAVATCGLSVTQIQVALLSKYPRRVIVFDNEFTAQQRASRLADSLAVIPGETAIVRLSGKDAATTPRHELAELRKEFLD